MKLIPTTFRVPTFASVGAILLLAVLASGCVTTTESVFTDEASPQKALERRVELARQYIGDANWEDAERNLTIAARIDAKNPQVHEAFGLLYQSTGELELAEQGFTTAIKLDRHFSRARNNYAVFLFSQQRYREAEQQLTQVVKDPLYDARPRAFINLGLCRLQLADSTGAEEAFVRALTMDRTNKIALLETAKLRFEAGDVAAASQYYGVYRTVARRQSPRGLWLGIRLAKAEGDQNAESSYALALQSLYPKSPEFQAYRKDQALE